MILIGRWEVVKEIKKLEEYEGVANAGTPYEHRYKSTRLVKNGEELCTVEIYVDPEIIAKEIGARACYTKRGFSAYMNKGVIAKVVKRVPRQ